MTGPVLGLHLDCMEYIEDFSDERLKAWCIQCGVPAHEVVLKEAGTSADPTASLITSGSDSKIGDRNSGPRYPSLQPKTEWRVGVHVPTGPPFKFLFCS